jgi:hypothetical protein
MDELIMEVYELIKDYRSDENIAGVQMSENRIRRWINQFNETDRVFLLTELKNILEKRYCTKQEVKDFLKEAVEVVAKEYKYSNVSEFLFETVFLELQRHNKSQPILLKLMKEVLSEQFDFNLDSCGTSQKKNYLYLDDVLCTGNTLFQDIKSWVAEVGDNEETNLTNLQSGKIRLIMVYLFIHNKNYYKKVKQFQFQIAKNFDSCYVLFRKFDIGNDITSKLEVVMPSDENQPDEVKEYQLHIEGKVNTYCEGKKISKPNNEFYRPSKQPENEEFYTSAINRKRFEDILLKKGINILNAAATNIPNLRALGYSLPSLKNFGFGALCFTWRNIPNNCPIVFWYSGGGFFPLFVKHAT